jgi:hypothetical protein
MKKAIRQSLVTIGGESIWYPGAGLPDALVRPAVGAVKAGKMPHQPGDLAPVYKKLAHVSEQLDRINEITAPRLETGTV